MSYLPSQLFIFSFSIGIDWLLNDYKIRNTWVCYTTPASVTLSADSIKHSFRRQRNKQYWCWLVPQTLIMSLIFLWKTAPGACFILKYIVVSFLRCHPLLIDHVNCPLCVEYCTSYVHNLSKLENKLVNWERPNKQNV